MTYNPSSFTGYGIPISPQATTGIAPASGSSGLMQFLMQLLQKKTGPKLFGSNKVPIDQNQITEGYIDGQGVYHTGQGT